jgi:hypothetical protein
MENKIISSEVVLTDNVTDASVEAVMTQVASLLYDDIVNS